MKNLYGYLSILLSLSLLLFPLLAGEKDATPVINTVPQEIIATEEKFKVKNTSSGEIAEISAKDYIIGVVSAEMPASYHEEALKAQAVAAYTFTLYRREENKENGFDITDDSNTDQAYITPEKLKEKWGETYEENYKKIEAAVTEVLGKTVTYENSLALTVYFAMSGGKTESAKTLWGKDIPYLVPTESVGDMLSPDYLSTSSFTKEEIIEKIPEIKDIPHTSWFASPVYSDSGTVITVNCGEISLDGKTIREKLNLRSANFDVAFKDDKFNFTVRGYGHQVGLSQYGAGYMALQGSSYTEILKWYYKGCEIS